MRRYLLDTGIMGDFIRPMQVVDMMIAAIATSLGQCTVVSSDSDLLAVPGLAVENWAESQ